MNDIKTKYYIDDMEVTVAEYYTAKEREIIAAVNGVMAALEHAQRVIHSVHPAETTDDAPANTDDA